MARTATRAAFDVPAHHLVLLTQDHEELYKSEGKTVEGAPSLSAYFEQRYIDAFEDVHSASLEAAKIEAAKAAYRKNQEAIAKAEEAKTKALEEQTALNAMLKRLNISTEEATAAAE